MQKRDRTDSVAGFDEYWSAGPLDLHRDLAMGMDLPGVGKGGPVHFSAEHFRVPANLSLSGGMGFSSARPDDIRGPSPKFAAAFAEGAHPAFADATSPSMRHKPEHDQHGREAGVAGAASGGEALRVALPPAVV